MLHAHELKGILVPIATPFRPDGELDLEAYGSYLDRLLERDVQGLVVNGTTGESPTTEWSEVERLLTATRERPGGRRLPLIAGTGTNDTRATVRRTERALRLGADAALVVVPYYSRPSQEGILEHFRAAAGVGLPVVVYEIPSRTGVRLTPETAAAILELDGVVGMKDSTGDASLLTALGGARSPKPILGGDDASFLAMLEAGAAGGFLASANVRTDEFARVYRLSAEGRREEAREAFGRLLPLIRLLFREPNPAPLKFALRCLGLLPAETLRLPMTPISAELRRELADALGEA